MAIESNSSEEAVAGSGGVLYTGIVPVKVVAVNPTLAELHAMGVMYQKEPSYVADFGDGALQKVVFWLMTKVEGGAAVHVPVEILINPSPWVSKDGTKTKFLNNLGQETWAVQLEIGKMDPTDLPQWYKNPETGYPCHRGMDTLIEFIKAWANVASGGKVYLENPGAVAKGNVKELKELLKVLDKNVLRVLVYVRDGKYQAVYTRHFGRMKPQRDDLFVAALNKEYGAIKGDYTIDWRQYTPGVVTPDPLPQNVSVGPDEDIELEGLDDDLPF